MSGEAATVVQAGAITGGVHLGAPRAAPSPARPITGWHPFDLDVHRAVGPTDLPYLPAYLPRGHDAALAAWLTPPSTGMAVLTGGSSTGKTRALYEAVAAHLPTWPLVYPRTAEDLLRVLAAGIEPGTVLWLNETQNHLTGTHGEQAAVALRTLLELPGPFVVLGTMWPRYWSALAAQPQAGGLLRHRVERIRVADRLTPAQATAAPDDPRLRRALATAHDGRVIQVLAGGPALVECHEHPDTTEDRYATAIVTAALDARRLGHHGLLPAALLAGAAPGYLDEEDRVDAPGTWFADGMAVAASDLLGVAALIPKRRGPGVGPPDGYDVHDYLDQHARTTRRRAVTPDSLWDALVEHTTDPEDRFRLARAAYHRLRYRHADPLYRQAADAAPDSAGRMVDVLVTHGRVDEAAALVARDAESRRVWTWPSSAAVHHRRRFTDLLVHRHGSRRHFGHHLADDLIALGEEDEAIDLLRHMAGPSDTRAAWKLGDLLARRGRWPEALEAMRHVDRQQVMPWLAEHLAAAGNRERLRELAEAGCFEAQVYLTGRIPDDIPTRRTRECLRATRPPARRLLAHLLDHNRTDVVVEMVIARTTPFETVETLVDLAVERGHRPLLISVLRSVLDDWDVADRLNWEYRAPMLLADLLVAEGRWDDALALARGAKWAQEWIPRQLAAAGNLDRLRALADAEQPHAQRELAALLAERRNFTELTDRTTKGDEHCARQLVALALDGALPDGERLLTDGL